MKIVVLGSGVIGVTTAYYLARVGAEVTVIDRQDGPALDTSFANAGQVSFGYSTPWGAPGIPMKALKWMFDKHAPLSIRPDGSLFQLRWMAQMLRNCSAERYAVNKERMLRLSNYSRECIDQLRADTGIEYEGRQAGTLQLFRSQKQVDQAQREIANRFDFKNTNSSIEQNDLVLTLRTVSEDRLAALRIVVEEKLVKRGVSLKGVDYGKIEEATQNTVRQLVTIKVGIGSDKAREINKLIKEKAPKGVSSQTQGESIRVTSKKRDDLQAVMTTLKAADLEIPLQFNNFRD